jgi:hypothetical protein
MYAAKASHIQHAGHNRGSGCKRAFLPRAGKSQFACKIPERKDLYETLGTTLERLSTVMRFKPSVKQAHCQLAPEFGETWSRYQPYFELPPSA